MQAVAASGQARRYVLATTDGLRLHNTAVEAVTYKGKRGVRVAVAPEIARRPEYAAGKMEPEAFAPRDACRAPRKTERLETTVVKVSR